MLKPIFLILISLLLSLVIVYFSKKSFKFDGITSIIVLLLTSIIYIIVSSNINVSLTYENFEENNKNNKDSTEKDVNNYKTSNNDNEEDDKSNNKLLDNKQEQIKKLAEERKPNTAKHTLNNSLDDNKNKRESVRASLIKKPSNEYNKVPAKKSGKHGTGKHGTGKHGSGKHGSGKHGSGKHGSGKHGTGKHGTGSDPRRHHTDRHHLIGGCHGTRFGCCPDGKTASNHSGSNCSTKTKLMCGESKFGCCPDGVTTRSNKRGSNCDGYEPPSKHHSKHNSKKNQKPQPINIVNNVTYKNDDVDTVGARASSGNNRGTNENTQRVPHYRRRSNVYDETPDYGPYYPGDDEDSGDSDDYDSKYFKEGWSYMKPSNWSVPHKRDPVCVSSKKCPVCPVESTIRPYSEFLGSKEWKKDHSL
jgi:hypothetical protein